MVGTVKGLYGLKPMKWKILTSLTHQKLLQYKYTRHPSESREGEAVGEWKAEGHFSEVADPGKLAARTAVSSSPMRAMAICICK